MANSTGEGKGLSGAQVRESLTYADTQNWDTPEDWVQLVADRLNALLAAQPADSALRLKKVEKLIAARRSQAEHIARVCRAESNQFRAGDVIAFCDELSTLLTEDSSQVGTKEKKT